MIYIYVPLDSSLCLVMKLHIRFVVTLTMVFLSVPLASANTCASGKDMLQFDISLNDFSSSYREVFYMSDGSQVDPRDNDHMRIAYEHMLMLMGGIGISHNDSHVNGDFYTKWVCPEEIPRIFMLATLGNFLTSPSDSKVWEGISSSHTPPVIVIDRSGKLTISNSFAQTRSMYLEALLLISVVAIARLSILKV